MIAIGPFLFFLDQLSLFAVGAAVVAIVLLAWRRPKRWIWYAFAKLGIFLTVGEVFKTILLPLDRLPLTADAVVYAIGLGLCGFGLVGVSRDISRKAGAHSGAGDPRGRVGVLSPEADEDVHVPLEERAGARKLERARMTSLEDRVTAEEQRNDRSETLADSAETRTDAHGESRSYEHDHFEEDKTDGESSGPV
jgi:hypothetical protein